MYSYNSLNDKLAGLNASVDALKKKEAKDEDFSVPFELNYRLQKNIKLIKDEKEAVEAQFLDTDKEFEEFVKKRFELYGKSGATIKNNPNGTRGVTDLDKLDEDKFDRGLTKLKKKYAEAIENQETISEKNDATAKEKKIEIKWHPLKKEWFDREEMPIGAFNDELIDLLDE